MNVRMIVGIALLIGGAAALYFGFQEASSFASDVSEMVTGSPTDRAMQLQVGGGVAAVIGLLLVLTGRGKAS
ncbi:DUF3185 family protein [Gaopeijia maritima]|uniref:DUF3185 family protein n=1 Tax=Gaopeijia maritima TaxID=3119007 RepID=A0ABU9E614_9BACT